MPFGKRQPSGYCGIERRRQTREKVDFSAYVVLSSGQLVKCRVTDYSSRGARIALASAFALPMHLNCEASAGIATPALCTVTLARRVWNSSSSNSASRDAEMA
jgi:PilZ domain